MYVPGREKADRRAQEGEANVAHERLTMGSFDRGKKIYYILLPAYIHTYVTAKACRRRQKKIDLRVVAVAVAVVVAVIVAVVVAIVVIVAAAVVAVVVRHFNLMECFSLSH